MVRADQKTWFQWVAPWVIDNADHPALPQSSGQGLVMIRYGQGTFRLAWMPLNTREAPRFDRIQYYHVGKARWSSEIDEDPGWEPFSHVLPYTHVDGVAARSEALDRPLRDGRRQGEF